MPERSVHSSQAIPPGAGIPQVGELLAGKYRIEGTLGVGGMGVVLAARHEAIGQAVAIKFLVVNDEEYLTEATQRLLREARAAAQLRGEHIVRVYDVGELPNGTPFIVMERLEGSDLAEISVRMGRLPIPMAVAFVMQAARAISEAHGVGIVHRDLKPSNLFIVRQPDGKALLKVVDFGISKSLRADPVELKTLTGARVALGSPHYMSPEQVRDARRVDARTDIWALGVILYELIAGRPAFNADSYPGIFAAITADTAPALATLRPEISAGLQRIIERCLERDPAARFQRAEELLRALEDYGARELKYDELFTSIVPPELSPNTLRAAVQAEAPSGARPVPSRQAATVPSEHAGTVALTHTKLSAGSGKLEIVEPSAPSQDVPAIAQSARSEFDTPRTRRSVADERAQADGSVARSKHVWIALAAAVFAVVLLWQLGQRQANRAAPVPAPSVSAARVAPVLLTIESNPAGARVSDGQRDYGTTPLRLSLGTETGLSPDQPRTFALSLSGYRTYVFERAPGPDATVMHIDLVRESPPAPPPLVETTPAVHAAPAATASPVTTSRPRPPRVAPSSSAETRPDIRLVR